MSTRGRANAIRTALELRGGSDPLRCSEMEAALSNCLSCKACAAECPSNVNLPLLKAELLHARHRQFGVSARERLFASVDLLGRTGCLAPRPGELPSAARPRSAGSSNSPSAFPPAARCLLYAAGRFDRWFARRPRRAPPPADGLYFGTTRLSAITSRTSAGRPWRCWKPRVSPCVLPAGREMLRPPGLQPGLPGRGRRRGPPQFAIIDTQFAGEPDPVPGTLLLLDVRRGLPGIEPARRGRSQESLPSL